MCIDDNSLANALLEGMNAQNERLELIIAIIHLRTD